MKRIKYKLLLLILLSNTLLFLVITVAFNLLIPQAYKRDAEKALMREYELFANDTEHSYSPTYLSGSISYMFLDENGKLYIDEKDIYNSLKQYRSKLNKERSEISDFCEDVEISGGQCYTYKTTGSYYVMTGFYMNIAENNMIVIMYINIKPFLDHTHTLDLVIFLLYICVSVLMSIIGSKIGSILDASREAEKKFFQNSSHELKTPLMSIQGYAEGIQMEVDEPKKAASVILRESERMAKLVDELLYISRIDANQLELHMKEIDIHEIIYDCIRFAEPLAEKKQCAVVPNFSDETQLVKCDEEQIMRAISNIVINAVYHCCAEVIISCVNDKKDIVITVRNDGESIQPDMLPHIFDRFYTGHKGGSGIGLSIAHEIIMLHNGRIEAVNEKNGTVFKIVLPIK
jgi:K+-sensing histidine kinase KdpD